MIKEKEKIVVTIKMPSSLKKDLDHFRIEEQSTLQDVCLMAIQNLLSENKKVSAY